ncbi:serum amyloid P-component-like [Oculina patagonica]
MGLALLHFVSLLALIMSVSSGETSKGQPAYNGLMYANFKTHSKSYLNITSVATELVQDKTDCAFACVATESCFSFNLARNKTSIKLCELLPSDKYINSDKFVTSQFYDHFSIPSPCSSGPCRNKGTCVPVYQTNSFTCLCAKGYTGGNCEIGGNDDIDADSCSCSSGLDGKQSCKTGYRLVFQTRSTDNYAMKQPAIGSDLSELSMCFFMKIVPDGQEHSVISYSKETANDLYISFPPQSTTVFIGNTKMSIDMVANSTWHHFCFTWENTNGVYKSYKDGKLEAQGDDFRKGYILRSGGTVVLGQDQDSIGGGFNTNDAFVGEMTEVNMWGSVLSESDIAAQYENCSIPHGSVLAWPIFKDVMHGQVQVVEP